jgi:small-conductance mechanosensitive channel
MFSDILQRSFLQNRILDYLIVLGTFLAGIFIIQMLKGIIISRMKAWAKKTATTIDDFLLRIIEKKLIPLLYIGAFYLSLNNLAIPSAVSRILDVSYAVIFTYVGLHLAVEVINYSLERYWARKEVDTSRQGSLKGVITILKVIVWGVGITFLLDNLGFEISAVVAGLGIGGIAVALAAQTILGDLFSYFVIFFDRPFEIGDFIIVDEYMGSIEYIGIKTTRVRSLGGEQLVFSNTDLTNARVRNYKRMQKRRIVFKLGVVYQTSSAQIKEIPGIIKGVIEQVDNTAFDRSHFASYGDFSLDFETVYYVLSGDYNKYMDIQQEINFAIKDEFDKLGIEFAYPTQTLFMEKAQENSKQ